MKRAPLQKCAPPKAPAAGAAVGGAEVLSAQLAAHTSRSADVHSPNGSALGLRINARAARRCVSAPPASECGAQHTQAAAATDGTPSSIVAALCDAGSCFKYPFKTHNTVILVRSLAQHCRGLPEHDLEPYAQLLEGYLLGDYLWVTAAQRPDQAFFHAGCKARLGIRSPADMDGPQKAAAALFRDALCNGAAPLLQQVLETASGVQADVPAYRGAAFPSEADMASYMEGLPDIVGVRFASYTTAVDMALRFAQVGPKVPPTSNPLNIQLGDQGYGHLLTRKYGLLAVCLGFETIALHGWDGVAQRERKVWLRGRQAVVTFSDTDLDRIMAALDTHLSGDGPSVRGLTPDAARDIKAMVSEAVRSCCHHLRVCIVQRTTPEVAAVVDAMPAGQRKQMRDTVASPVAATPASQCLQMRDALTSPIRATQPSLRWQLARPSVASPPPLKDRRAASPLAAAVLGSGSAPSDRCTSGSSISARLEEGAGRHLAREGGLPTPSRFARIERQKAIKKQKSPPLPMLAQVMRGLKAAAGFHEKDGALPEYKDMELPKWKQSDVQDMQEGVNGLLQRITAELDAASSKTCVQKGDVLAAAAILFSSSRDAEAQVETDGSWPSLSFIPRQKLKDNIIWHSHRLKIVGLVFEPEAILFLQRILWRCYLTVALNALSQHKHKGRFIPAGVVRRVLRDSCGISVYGEDLQKRRWRAGALVQPRKCAKEEDVD